MTKKLTLLRTGRATRLAEMAGQELCRHLVSIQRTGRIPRVALSGGGIGIATLAAAAAYEPAPDWNCVAFYFSDERFVPFDSLDRNAVQARAALLDRRAVPEANIHEMPSAADLTVEQAAAAYPLPDRFDVVLLGIGSDGHIASLFPEYPQVLSEQRVVAVTDSPKPPPHRISLTLAEIRRSQEVWLLAAGQAKARALEVAWTSFGTCDPEVLLGAPAAGAVGVHRTRWFADDEAAARISVDPG